MKAFIGINIPMGIHKIPALVDYSSTDEALRVPYISRKMPRNRFEQLCKYIHLSDSVSTSESDKLRILEENVPKLLHPWQALSVDEAMIILIEDFYGNSICPKGQ